MMLLDSQQDKTKIIIASISLIALIAWVLLFILPNFLTQPATDTNKTTDQNQQTTICPICQVCPTCPVCPNCPTPQCDCTALQSNVTTLTQQLTKITTEKGELQKQLNECQDKNTNCTPSDYNSIKIDLNTCRNDYTKTYSLMNDINSDRNTCKAQLRDLNALIDYNAIAINQNLQNCLTQKNDLNTQLTTCKNDYNTSQTNYLNYYAQNAICQNNLNQKTIDLNTCLNATIQLQNTNHDLNILFTNCDNNKNTLQTKIQHIYTTINDFNIMSLDTNTDQERIRQLIQDTNNWM